MTITIRPALPQDEARCLELLSLLRNEQPQPAWTTVFRQLLTRERGQILVAEEAQADGSHILLGSASVTFNLAMRYGGEYCQLEELIVAPEARGKKLGGLLLEATIAEARQRGCAEYGLYLVEWTTHNRTFYEKYGLKTVGDEMRMAL